MSIIEAALAAFGIGAREPTTHDYYSHRGWGHDYFIDHVEDGGIRLRGGGWGSGIEEGDFLLLRNGAASTRYRVSRIQYMSDPPDMWFATLDFAPRKEESNG